MGGLPFSEGKREGVDGGGVGERTWERAGKEGNCDHAGKNKFNKK